MKNASFQSSVLAIGLSLLATAAATPAWSAERGPLRRAPSVQPVETEARVIVKFKADSSMMRALAASRAERPLQAQAMSARLGLALSDGHALGVHTQVLTGSGISSRELAARLSAQPDVEYAEVDERARAYATVPNDPFYKAAVSPAAGQWYLQAPSSTLVSAVNAEAAWAISTGKSSVVVAVLDTGVRPGHPDLVGKLLQGYDFISTASIANDNDGRDDDPSDPGDWITSTEDNLVGGPFYHCGRQNSAGAYIGEDSSWHGTQTAGLIGAATNNGIGMASMGRDVMILPVRVLGKCGGMESDIVVAMLWAAGIDVPGVKANLNPAKVINMSLGSASPTCSQTYQNAVNAVLAAGVVVVAAAGNDGLAVGSPANCAGVIGVAGVRHSGTKVGYSSLGPKASISAPAGNCFNKTGACLYPLLTTSNTGTKGPVADTYTDGVSELTASLGTSFSSPLVAGTAALMISANPLLTPAEVLAALKSTARTFPITGAAPIQRVLNGPFVAVSQCTAPTATAQDYECYCTTSTCGAGLLDAGAAVAAVTVVTANISVASSTAAVGSAVLLDGAQSKSSGTASITTYLWAITSGNATFTSATNASSATLSTSSAGSVVVSLTVTDSNGRQASTSTTLTVNAAAGPTSTPTTSSGDSGGGGALNLEWLLTLVVSTLALCLAARRQRRVLAKAAR
jgi:serine protease